MEIMLRLSEILDSLFNEIHSELEITIPFWQMCGFPNFVLNIGFAMC